MYERFLREDPRTPIKAEAEGHMAALRTKLDYEPRELWLRSALGSFGLAVLGLLLLGFAYGLIEEAEFRDAKGVIHLVLFLLYVPAGIAWYCCSVAFGAAAWWFAYAA